jgi:type II secretory ATPase GspE/PulE/Tfp pilus assembly ATPase PilB-like protein
MRRDWGVPRRSGNCAPARTAITICAGVFAKIKKLAKLDVAERNHAQRGRVRLLNFHGGSAEFEVTTGRIGKGERMTLMRL